MKKTRALLLSILLIILAFTSCNLDGTSGIFRQIAQSKAPLGIRYEQLLGINGSDLYFRTADGVERVDAAKNNTPVATSTKGKLIHAAALSSVYNKVFYITNDEDELKAGTVHVVDVDTATLGTSTITVTADQAPSITTELSIKGLYANSMVLVTGKDGAGKKVFDLLEYSVAVPENFKTPIAGFASVPVDYDLESVIQQTAKEQELLEPMIVSFINISGNREHYLVNPSGPTETFLGTEDVQIANFVYHAPNNLYVLTTDGKIYHVNGTTWTSIATSSKTYAPNAFALAVDDGTDYHLITKPSAKSSSLHVFTFPMALPNTAVAAGVDVKSGYAKELSLATIVSAQQKSIGPAKLLVATHENGMYDITINEASANVDSDANGLTSKPEEYTF